MATRYLRGGSERRIRDIVRSLPEASHHVVVGPDSDLDLVRRELEPDDLIVAPSLIRNPAPRADRATVRWLLKLLRDAPFDVAVTHQSKAGAVGRMAARRAGGPPVIHSLSMASFGPGYPRWQDVLFRSVERWLEPATAVYAVVGEDLARRYAALGVPVEKLRVVRSGVPLPTSEDHRGPAEVRRHLGIGTDRPMVLSLGSLEPRKNVLDLPEYLSRLLAMDVPRRPCLVVAGHGPLGRPLRDAVRRESLTGDAYVIGFVDDPGPLVAAADAVILLSGAEGLPQVLVQAAAAGTPFVSYEVDGARELLHLGAAGAVVPPGDVERAAEVTARVLQGGRGGRPSIDLSSWSPDVIAAGYRDLIDTVLPRTLAGPTGGNR